MAKQTSTKRPIARDLGVPTEYLSDNGRFRPGYDAKYKSDLISIALSLDVADRDRQAAANQLTKLGWRAHLDKAREVRIAKAQPKSQFARGYQAALADVVKANEEGGVKAVRAWIKANLLPE